MSAGTLETGSTVNPAYAKTIELLTKTRNQAAVSALIPGLDADDPEVQRGALAALLDRRDPLGQEAILRRIDFHNPVWDELLERKHGRITQALRDAVLGQDLTACEVACQTIVRYREYDLVPVLIAAAEATSSESSELAAPAILELAQTLYQDLQGPRDYSDRRDPQFVRRIVVGHLEKSAERYPEHQSKESIESFLLLASRDDALLQVVLYDPQHPCYLPFVDILAQGKHVGIIRLLLEFLDANQTPGVVLSTVNQRSDRGFVRRFIARWRDHATPGLRSSIKRMEGFPWANLDDGLLSRLDEEDQVATLSLLIASGTPREEAFEIVRYFLHNGAKKARHTAMDLLADFSDAEADSLVVRALSDKDQDIVVKAIAQARQRSISGVMPQIVAMAEHENDVIRQAAFEHLPEFHFDRYWAGFELMEEVSRAATGELVRRIDPSYLDRIRADLSSTKRSRRIKAAAVASAMNVAPLVEEQLIDFLQDDDELVREEMALALGGCNSDAARVALKAAAQDRFPNVRTAVEQSLKKIGQDKAAPSSDDTSSILDLASQQMSDLTTEQPS